MSRARDIAVELFGRALNTDPREMLFHCGECGAPKLYVNAQSGAFYCMRCQYKGSVFRLAQIGYIPSVGPKQELSWLPPTLEQIEASPLRPNSAPFRYLVRRGFTAEQIREFGVCGSNYEGSVFLTVVDGTGRDVGTTKKYVRLRRSAIFPLYDGGYKGYQARYMDATEKSKRWMSAPGTRRKSLLFNADKALSPANDYIFIAEGIPAACALGPQAVATFGKSFSEPQLERLVGAPQELLYVAYDGDATQEARKLALALLEVGKRVRIVHFTGDEDPDSVPDLRRRVERATEYTYDELLSSAPRESGSVFSSWLARRR